MAMFKTLAPGVEVNGETVLSIVNRMGIFKKQAYEILRKNGIVDPKPGQWYSQQSWLNAFKTISDELGQATLSIIGKKIPDNAQWPPEVDNIEKALGSIDVAYHMNHRNGEIGHYKFEKVGDREFKITCNNPYPCDFDKGLIEAVALKFKPADVIGLRVKHDDSKPCRKKGHDSCTYIVTW